MKDGNGKILMARYGSELYTVAKYEESNKRVLLAIDDEMWRNYILADVKDVEFVLV